MEPDPVFQKALEKFKDDLTAQQCREFGITTLQDVKDEVKKIQIEHGSAKKLRGMSRMSKFLEAMQQLEQVISVFLNVSEVVAFIWGPIKFFLVVASSRLEILECLLDTFTDISEAMPDLQGYVSIFQDQPEVLEVLKRCYGDIIQFYHMALGVLGRPGAFGIRDWRRIFDSIWKTFRTKFSPVLNSLRRHRELLVQVKLTATFGAVETTRRVLQETIEKSNEELKQILDIINQKRKQILDKLGSHGHHNDKGHRRLPDQRYPTSGDWILEEPHFLQWFDPEDPSNDLLYLNGMPGAGKTTLVSRVIDGMTKETTAQQRPLLNFYFEHGQSGKNLMMDMLCSFIEQLLRQDDAIVDDLHETVLPARPSDLSSVSWLEDIATRIILSQKRCYIIVDGLDECALDQRRPILQWLRTILFKAKSSDVVVKVLVSGQRDGVIDAILQDCACTIRLDNQTPHLRDIEKFSSSILTQIEDRFAGLEDEEEIRKRLDPSRITQASKGMFMYAKVVLENFLSQTSIYELEQEVEREYPSGLDEAYDRVAERVLEKTSDSRKRAALQILSMICCAARPLKWREIQCYFCIDALKGSCDPRRRKVSEPKDLCGSFVESEDCTSFPNMPSEAQLVMVHNTARSYLLRSGRLDMLQQHKQMSLFCFQYLTGSAFKMVSQDTKSASATALTGFYGFFDYAAAHWDHHAVQYVGQASIRAPDQLSEEGLGKPLSAAWMDFSKRFCDNHESILEALSKDDVPLDTSVPQSVPHGAAGPEGESYNIQEMFEGWDSTQRSTEFEYLARDLRQIVQQTDLGTLIDREKAVYLSLNGPLRLKCSRRACVYFNIGFESEVDLLLHISWHEMNFKCPHTGCYAWRAGFRTNTLLQTHLKRAHPAIDSEETLFPGKTRRRPRTLMEACRLGDIELVQTFAISVYTKADMHAANRALHAAARAGHFAVCVHLTKQGANPYATQSEDYGVKRSGTSISVIQMSIRHGELDSFTALKNAARGHYQSAFIEEPLALLECVLDAIESPVPQFLASVLEWNERRTVPLTLNTILLRASCKTRRQEHGVERPVLFEDRMVHQGLHILLSSEFERYRRYGQSPECCYEKGLVVLDAGGWSLLHRLCGGGPDYTASGAVKFLLKNLKPEDIQRHDLKGNPPLFTALRKTLRCEGTALDDQADIVRSFFEFDPDGSKRTQNAGGNGLLEFAFTHAKFQIIPLIIELCGANYSVVQFDDPLKFQTDREFEKRSLVFGLGGKDERIHLAVKVGSREVDRFTRWLTDLASENEVLKMLQSLILDMPQETTRVEPINGVITRSSDPPQSDHTKAARVILTLTGAEKLPKRCRPKLEDLGRTQLRKVLTCCLRAKLRRFDIEQILLEGYWKENEKTHETDSSIYELYTWLLEEDFSSRELQSRLTQVILSISKGSRTWYYGDLRKYVETLIQYADAVEDYLFMASLELIRQGL